MIMKSKAIWWTTGICAVFGALVSGLAGLLSMGILGFLASFTVVGLYRADQKSKQKDGISLLVQ